MFTDKLHNGERLTGTMIRMIKDPGVAQVAKNAGLDFIMLDMEHGAYSIESFADVAKVARSIGLGIFVRVPELSKAYVSGLMDAGAQGLMVPMVSTEEEAKKLAGWARYPSIGKRGFGSTAVFTDFDSPKTDIQTFMDQQNRDTLAIAQIETKEAIDNIEKIAAVEGIDVLLIGPNDLAISLGVPGEMTGPVVTEAIGKVKAAAEKYGKKFSMHAGDSVLKYWICSEMQIIMSDIDINVIKMGFNQIARKYSEK